MEEQNKLDRLPSVLLWVVVGAALILLIAYIWVFHGLPANESPPAWGAFGDYVGGILNPLVSSFTLVVAVRVWQLQKIELKNTHNEIKKQRNQQRFFDLLQIYQQVVNSIGYTERSGTPSIGKNALLKIRIALEERGGDDLESGDWCTLLAESCTHNLEMAPRSLQLLRAEWKNSEYGHLYANYFHTVTALLEEAPNLLDQEALRYIRLFRLQLSHDELVLLAYFMWLDDGGQQLLNLSKKCGLLENLHPDRKIDFGSVLPSSVFGMENPSSIHPSTC
jgi:hypothetical protein